METLIPEDVVKTKDEVEGQDDNDEVCMVCTNTTEQCCLLLLVVVGGYTFGGANTPAQRVPSLCSISSQFLFLGSAAGASFTPPGCGCVRFLYLESHNEFCKSFLELKSCRIKAVLRQQLIDCALPVLGWLEVEASAPRSRWIVSVFVACAGRPLTYLASCPASTCVLRCTVDIPPITCARRCHTHTSKCVLSLCGVMLCLLLTFAMVVW